MSTLPFEGRSKHSMHCGEGSAETMSNLALGADKLPEPPCATASPHTLYLLIHSEGGMCCAATIGTNELCLRWARP